MLRSNGNSGKIRESDLVFVPHCPIRASQAWRSQGHVFAMPARCARHAGAGWQEQSSVKNLHRRRAARASSVLDAFSCVDSMHDGTPKSNRPGVGGRGWGHGQCMDKAQEGSGADWITTRRYLAATGTLRIGKWQVSPTSRGVNFLGYRIWKTHKLIRKDSVIRAKRKIARYIGNQDQESLSKFLASWSGHAKWADTHHLFKWLEQKHGITT